MIENWPDIWCNLRNLAPCHTTRSLPCPFDQQVVYAYPPDSPSLLMFPNVQFWRRCWYFHSVKFWGSLILLVVSGYLYLHAQCWRVPNYLVGFEPLCQARHSFVFNECWSLLQLSCALVVRWALQTCSRWNYRQELPWDCSLNPFVVSEHRRSMIYGGSLRADDLLLDIWLILQLM